MQPSSVIRPRRTALSRLTLITLLALLLAQAAAAQQTYVTRYDAFVGYTYLNSPAISLAENGVHIQVGLRPAFWYSLGLDYSTASGDLLLKPDMLTSELQTRLGQQLQALAAAGKIPAGYALQVPTRSRTQTFAAGPQLAYRHWKPVTLLLRPSIGLIREAAVPDPKDPIAAGIVKQLAPSGKKVDWTPFYGVGGGVDLNVSRHLGLRIQVDVVRDHLFPGLLATSRNTVRFSIGPCFNFGRNIVK